MDATGPEEVTAAASTPVTCQFGGGDVMAVPGPNGADRVRHVHFKNIRPEDGHQVTSGTENKSFLDAVIAGAFTVPGDRDGCHRLSRLSPNSPEEDGSYAGWIVVEAEQDPAKAPPYAYSKLGYRPHRC